MPKSEKSDKPKQPPSAYILFCSDKRKEILAEDPELASQGVGAIATVLGQRWKALSDAEKKPYNDRAEADRKAHNEKYGKVTKSKKDPNAPKRAPTPFFNFSKIMRPQVISENPELKSNVTEVAKIIGQKWKALSDEEKKSYVVSE